MGFISTNCPGCGSPIELDDTREYGFCQFCGTKIVQDKVIVEHRGEVKIDNSELVEKYLQNAHRALSKHDWEEVEKYYNLIEQNTFNNMEAAFFSSYGKAMLSLSDSDFHKREQKFDVLTRSMSVISDYYDNTSENKEEVLRRINDYIKAMYSLNSVTNYNKEGTTLSGSLMDGLLKNPGSYRWHYALLNTVKEAFVTELKQIQEKHNDDYIEELIIENVGQGQSTNNNNKPENNAPEKSMPLISAETSKPEEITNPVEKKGIIYNYKNFKSLPTKKKVLYIAIPLIILLVLINAFGGGGVSDKMYIAAAQDVVTDPASVGMYIDGNLGFTGGDVVDKDKYGRALVVLNYDDQLLGDSQVAVVIFDFDKSDNTYRYYNTLANHGRRFISGFGTGLTKDDIIECKEMVDWGNPIN